MSQPGKRPARLRKRAEFLRVASGLRWRGRFVALQMAAPEGDAAPRFGLTVTRKVGGAVERNRIRRRLRAALREIAGQGEAGRDYVVVAERAALEAPFADLADDLSAALTNLRRGRGRPAGKRRKA